MARLMWLLWLPLRLLPLAVRRLPLVLPPLHLLVPGRPSALLILVTTMTGRRLCVTPLLPLGKLAFRMTCGPRISECHPTSPEWLTTSTTIALTRTLLMRLRRRPELAPIRPLSAMVWTAPLTPMILLSRMLRAKMNVARGLSYAGCLTCTSTASIRAETPATRRKGTLLPSNARSSTG